MANWGAHAMARSDGGVRVYAGLDRGVNSRSFRLGEANPGGGELVGCTGRRRNDYQHRQRGGRQALAAKLPAVAWVLAKNTVGSLCPPHSITGTLGT